MIVDRKNELEKLMKFVVGIDGDITGTVLERRIEEICGVDQAKNQVYKPGTGGMNKNRKNYTQEQIDLQMKLQEEHVHVFGYVNDPAVDNNTHFFDYEEAGIAVKPENK